MVPTLFVGIGDRGVRIAQGAHRQAIAARPEADGILAVLAVLPDQASAPEGVDAAVACASAEDSGVRQLPEDCADTVRSLARVLLDPNALHAAGVVPGALCEVVIVADLQDPLACDVALQVADIAGRGIEEAVAGLSVRVILHLIVPQGRCNEGPAVARALEAAASSCEGSDPPFDRAVLVSGASPAALFTGEDLDAQCSLALAMRAVEPVGDAMRQAETDQHAWGAHRIGSLGLGVVELPVEAIAERIGLEAALEIVSKGINASCTRSDDVDRAEKEALKQLRFDVEGITSLRERLIHYDSGGSRRSVLDDIRIPHIAFEDIKRPRWHILLANYDVYFRRERLDVAVARVKANADAINAEVADCIRRAVDHVVTAGRDPSNALELLKRIHRVANEARESLLRNRVARSTSGGASQSNLPELLKKLGEAAASEPRLSPMLFRGLIASLAIALGLMGFLRLGWLGRIPTSGVESAPYWLAAFLIPFAISAAMAWRRAHRAMALTEDLRDRCQKAMREDAVARINAVVENALDRITGTALYLTAKPDDLKTLDPKYAGPNESRSVEDFMALLKNELSQAIRPPEPPRREGWRLDVQAYAPHPPTFHYADTPGFHAWTGEADTLILNGLFTDWRNADAASIARQIEAHAIGRNPHILSLTLDAFHRQWLAEAAPGWNPVVSLHNDLRSVAAPPIMAGGLGGDSPTATFVAGPGSGEGGFGQALREAGGVNGVIGHGSPCRCLMIRTVSEIRPQDLDAWSMWTSQEPSADETGGGAP